MPAHEPQLSEPPQPSPAGPQVMLCAAHVLGVHVPLPHWPAAPPPPQANGEVQRPQLIEPPQPSPAGPHEMLSCVHVFGTQVG